MIGSIQGRLLPPVNGRTQAFPGDRWPEEFQLLRTVGYTSIELTIDCASWLGHPINSAQGRARLRELSSAVQISLSGICCDVFMETPLLSSDQAVAGAAESMLRELIRNSAEAALPFLELPFMGENSLKQTERFPQLARILDWALPLAEEYGLDLLLETDLSPLELKELLTRFAHPRLGLNYDTGNSTWFGFDPVEEIQAIHMGIRNVHIKDCTRKDYSVPLGLGETQFDSIMSLLQRSGYQGDFIIQGARQPDDIAAARDYLQFTSRLVRKYFTSADNI